MRNFKYLYIFILAALPVINAYSQQPLTWNTLPSLPDKEGFAGMFAGTIGDNLFCMGGANFPDKRPWEGGTKKWYSNIYKLDTGGEWIKLKDTLANPLAYGVSVSTGEKIILIGGSSDNIHSNKVTELTWKDNRIVQKAWPSIPVPLANMTGGKINKLIIIAGGSSAPTTPALKKVFALDTERINEGWFELPTWPGPERTLPISAVTSETFYLFSGEKVGTNADNEKYRYILQDAYAFVPKKVRGRWTGTWKMIAPMPQGASAAGNPLPVLNDGTIVITGGVDVITALHTDAATHPGITTVVQLYNPKDNSWQVFRSPETAPARVTLPVVFWNNQWVYVSGEIKAGVRTNTLVSIKP